MCVKWYLCFLPDNWLEGNDANADGPSRVEGFDLIDKDDFLFPGLSDAGDDDGMSPTDALTVCTWSILL